MSDVPSRRFERGSLAKDPRWDSKLTNERLRFFSSLSSGLGATSLVASIITGFSPYMAGTTSKPNVGVAVALLVAAVALLIGAYTCIVHLGIED